MRLLGMVDALKTQEQDPAARELSFLERLGLLVDQQWNWRENQALARRLACRQAEGRLRRRYRLPRFSRAGQERDPRAGAESAWVARHENIFVLGPTGVGKSFVACALAQKACRDGYSALYTRRSAVPRSRHGARRWQFAQSAGAAQPHRCAGDRRLGHGSAGRNRTPRLLGDLRGPLSNSLDDPDLATSRRALARADRRSHAADGILDRLVHNAHRIEMRGDSMRKKRGASSRRANARRVSPALRRGQGLPPLSPHPFLR